MELTNRQHRVLNAIEESFPIVPKPYCLIAENLELSEEDVIEDIRTMKEFGIIRQISSILHSHQFGYRSTPIIAQIENTRIDEALSVLNSHPGVNRSFTHENDFNVCYKLTVPPLSSLNRHVDLLHYLSGAINTRQLHNIEFSNGIASSHLSENLSYDNEAIHEFSELELNIIREIQEDLPLLERPFMAQAIEAQCSEDELIDTIRKFINKSFMSRMAVVMNPRYIKPISLYSAWFVPENSFNQIIDLFSNHIRVDSCYRSDTDERWPYSLVVKVSGDNFDECEVLTKELSQQISSEEYKIFSPIKEYKNIHLRYFTPEWDAYLASHEKELSS